VSAHPEHFAELADKLDLDEFERLAAWTLLTDPAISTDKLMIELGAVIADKVHAWIAEPS
jgi:hypothetical protein